MAIVVRTTSRTAAEAKAARNVITMRRQQEYDRILRDQRAPHDHREPKTDADRERVANAQRKRELRAARMHKKSGRGPFTSETLDPPQN